MAVQPRTIVLDVKGNPSMGYLAVAENQKSIPFSIQRVYWTFGAPPNTQRGMHAHKKLEQVIFALHGSLTIDLDNGLGEKHQFVLDEPNKGVYIPLMWWRDIIFSENTVLLSLASQLYDENDYFRDYDDFLKAVRA